MLGVGIAQEAYEEFTTENEIVDVGPFILKHKEERSVSELYDDIQSAIFNVDGIEQIYDSKDMTKADKMNLLDNIAQAIGEEANIKTDGFTTTTLFKKTEGGMYLNLYAGSFSTPSGSVVLKDSLIDRASLDKAVEVLVHEMMHAVELENTMMSNNVTDFDKQLYGAKDFFNKDSYHSSFLEMNTNFLTAKTMSSLQDKYDLASSEERGKNNVVFNEIIKGLYEVDYESQSFLRDVFGNTKGNAVTNENYYNYMDDVNNYKFKTLEDLVMLNYKQKLDNINIDYENVNLKDTYYYKTAMYALQDKANVRLIDYKVGRYNIKIDNVKENIQNFEGQLDELNDYEVATTLSEYVNAIRYNSDDYESQDKKLIIQTINKYIDSLSENHIDRLGLYDATNVMQNSIKQDSVSIKGQDSNTNEPRLLTPDDIEWNP